MSARRRTIATMTDYDDTMSLDKAIELASDTDLPATDILQRYPVLNNISDRERANIAIALLVSSATT